jgi:xanthine dehydrogenase accessory factor
VTSPAELLVEAGRLAAAGEPYALATVTRVVRPASTRRGDRALVTREGELEGWVGGACSEHVVVREALAALTEGKPRLVCIGPPGAEADIPDDVTFAESPCASEGVVEVLIEPCLPAPLLAVIGDSPAAHALAKLARDIGWRVREEVVPEADAVVVASMGRGDEEALAAALATRARYVGLVASERRARSVLATMRATDLRGDPSGATPRWDEESLTRVHSPAGLDLGASTQEEIAVAILAQLVAWRHAAAGLDYAPREERANAS